MMKDQTKNPALGPVQEGYDTAYISPFDCFFDDTSLFSKRKNKSILI